MANRWPISTGNWSNAAIWSGSLIPTASDDVFTNNQIVFVDTDVTIRSIRNSATGSAIASAAQANCFYLNNGVTLTANVGGVIGAASGPNNTTNFPTIIISGSSSAKIISNITSSVNYGCAIIMTNGASLTITGSIRPIGVGSEHRTILSASTGSLFISGSVISDAGAYFGAAIRLTAATRTDINGNIFGSIGASGFYAVESYAAALVTITGSIIGSSQPQHVIGNLSTGTCIISGSVTSGAGGLGILNNSTGTVIVTGSVTAVSGYGINNASTGIVSVSGSVTAGTSNSGIISTTAGRITVIGPISSSISFPGVQSTSTTAINTFTGPFFNANGRNAVFAQNLQLISGSTPTWQFDTETYGEQRTLYTQNYPGNFPSTTNVRQGTVFGDISQFTGTVAIPVASNVLKGVPLDNTTGSASFTTQNVWSVLTSSLNVTESIGERLKNASTVATDGILITSKGTL